MRALVLLLLLGGLARAQPAPIRVAIECEGDGRTKACSAFLVALVEENPLLVSAPRAAADVVLYVNANEVALVDRVHLRFVSTLPNTPPVIELDVDLDTRATDDEQRAQLEPAFLRGVALYIAARYPGAVTVTIAKPDAITVAKPSTTPWGFALELGGSGNYTENFQSYSAYLGIEVTRVTRRDKAELGAYANGGINRQPPLELDDGSEVSLDSSRWQVGASGGGAYLLNRCHSIGAASSILRDDDKGQFRYHSSTKAGLEWDRFAADDPRGNRLAVAYLAGYVVERYHVANVDGERFAHYPTHEVIASGAVRQDTVTLGLAVTARAEVLHPLRRHTLSASPSIEWQLGDHVDLGLGFTVAKRELPGPDLALIDPDDYERLSRLSYADPLQINGYLNIRVHWDRTNGVRNDRFDDL